MSTKPGEVQNEEAATIAMYDVISDTTSPFRAALVRKPLNLQQYLLESGMDNYLHQIQLDQQDLFAGKKKPESLLCRIAVAKSQVTLPSKEEVSQFATKTLPDLRFEIWRNFKRVFGETAAWTLRKPLYSWEPQFSQTKDEYLELLKASLRSAIRAQKDSFSEREQLLSSLDRDRQFAIELAFFRKGKVEAQSEKICAIFADRSFTLDEAFIQRQQFLVGAISLKFPAALTIVQHELWHLVESELDNNSDLRALTRERMHRVRECLLHNHNEESAPDLIQDPVAYQDWGRSKYEAEDFADLVAATSNKFRANNSCFFMKTNPNDISSTPTGWTEAIFAFRNGDRWDGHSSDFFRLLHAEFLRKGNLPPVCREAVSSQGAKADFKNCFE